MIRRLRRHGGGAVLLVVLAGCSGGELEETSALLEECRTDKVAAQDATHACEERYQREVRQWENMESVIEDVLPQTLADFRSEREQILELVPSSARDEVRDYIEELSDMMGRGFQVMLEESESTLLELEIAQTKLDALQVTTDTLDSRSASIAATLEGDLRKAIERQREASREANELIGSIRSFDEKYVMSQESEDRLKLNRNQRETIAAFHTRLLTDLAALASAR